jgi:pilus assembly protein CpaF
MAKKVVIFGTKGGVGKTLIAANLAVSLVKDQNKKVCLVDLDLHVVGDMARMLGVRPEKALVDLMQVLKQYPERAQKENFITASSFGVDFLAAVLRQQQSPHLDSSRIKDVLALLDKDYDYMIIDAGESFSETFVYALNQANLILLIVTPDNLSIYQAKSALETMQSLGFPLAMVRIILNRAESVAAISWQEVRVSLTPDIIARIPSEGKVTGHAVNQGIPVVVNSPRAKISQAIRKLATDLVTQDNLFLAHQEAGELALRDFPLEKTGAFWKAQNLTESLIEPRISEEEDKALALKRRIHNRLIDALNLKKMDLKVFSDAHKRNELKERARAAVADILTEEAGTFISSSELRNKMVKEILDEALGLGALEDLLADPSITDIMVNNKDEVYIERNGRIELTNKRFISNDQVRVIIERILAPIGRHIDESTPMVDARLADGSRVNAIIPPLSLTGPSITIRKFRKERFRIEELINIGTLSLQMADFIRACVLVRENIIVSGGTGSGKTTVLNVLSEFITGNERIVTIEDAAELKLHQEHWIRLESRPPNIEGRGAITTRDLFRNTLRMRPDRIVIGECRGIETLDMLQAMNTGHDGSMTTIHANSTQDVLTRIDWLCRGYHRAYCSLIRREP